MDRRSALRSFVILSASFAFIPSCKDETETNLSETILPVKSDAHLFVLTMVNDCYSAADKKKFFEGMKQFDKRFSKEKQKLLQELEEKKDASEPINFFYNTTRSLTLQHYMTSENYLVKVRKFEMAPGRFNGCFPVEKKSV